MSSDWVAISSVATPLSIERWRTTAWASDTSGASAGSRRGGEGGAGGGSASRPASISASSSAPRRCSVCWGRPRMFSSASLVARLAAGQLHQRLVGHHERGRAVHLACHPFAPRRQPPRDGPPGGVEAPDLGQPLVRALGGALVARLLHRAALLERPFQPPALVQIALQRVAEREQAAGIVGGVVDLRRR